MPWKAIDQARHAMAALSFAGLCQAPAGVLSKVSFYSPVRSHLHKRATESRSEMKLQGTWGWVLESLGVVTLVGEEKKATDNEEDNGKDGDMGEDNITEDGAKDEDLDSDANERTIVTTGPWGGSVPNIQPRPRSSEDEKEPEERWGEGALLGVVYRCVKKVGGHRSGHSVGSIDISVIYTDGGRKGGRQRESENDNENEQQQLRTTSAVVSTVYRVRTEPVRTCPALQF
ncbi:hypothetical protein V501_05836 [Pseudogymnoascus sp. VKM F-4519 (FW-2642)]|nr:hypothetical protein V501_05836 [Pseudogymnoascus sp. VKM F-4519 (FW-2642)]